MKTVEESRRELFETLWQASGMEKFKETAWWAFEAALDSLVVTLPEMIGENNGGCSYESGIHDGVILNCKESIELLNLGIKVK